MISCSVNPRRWRPFKKDLSELVRAGFLGWTAENASVNFELAEDESDFFVAILISFFRC
jgi:hypothetical protein